MKEILIRILNALGRAYWVKIETKEPSCTYYFGPFINVDDARSAQAGYLEDLTQEGAVDIKVDIRRCKPNELTILEEQGELDFNSTPVFSTQP